MGMYAVDTADSDALAELQGAAVQGRAAATLRRRQLSQGKQALNGAGALNANGNGASAPTATADLNANGAAEPTAAANGHGAANGQAPATSAPPAPRATAAAVDGVSDAHLGRAYSRERRRQLSQGKGALNGAAAPRPVEKPKATADAPSAATNGQAQAASAPAAPRATAAAIDGVADAHLGRAYSRERRRQLSQGKGALDAAGRPAASPAQAPAPAPRAPSPALDGVADAHLGRAYSRERRRQLSQGKAALNDGGGRAPAPAPAAPAPAPESRPAEPPTSGRDEARARRAAASRLGGAAPSRPERVGPVVYAPKVIASPTHGGQEVTGLRIGPGVRVTGDEYGAALPVSGTQYVGADGPPPAPGAGTKVGLARTPQGLVVSGTTVRSKVPITGDEFGEHLRITGEADQKLHDDLTPRSDGAYRTTQFPRRSDPHGASAVGTRLAPQRPIAPATGDGTWRPNEVTDGGRPVTGTAVGRSGRVTGNEAGACRPITGDQYQAFRSSSTECGGTGGGTAPAAHMNGARLDPVTLGKVTVAQTWGGQRVTGPSVEHRSNVTGDEPGSCRPLTGTPYQGPSTAFGWCEPDQGDLAGRRLDPRPHGVAVTGDVPMHAKAVTGTERGRGSNVTGTPYYNDPRAPEAASDDWASTQSFPVAWARRLAGRDGASGAEAGSDGPPPPPSSLPGGITGSFAVGDGKVTGNQEFLFHARPREDGKQPPVTGEGRAEGGRTVTGSAWTMNDRVTGTEGYIAARRNPSQRGGKPHGWTGALKFRDHATPDGPRQIVTGLSGWTAKAAAKITLSGGAQG